jgi:hypothetical protein
MVAFVLEWMADANTKIEVTVLEFVTKLPLYSSSSLNTFTQISSKFFPNKGTGWKALPSRHIVILVIVSLWRYRIGWRFSTA